MAELAVGLIACRRARERRGMVEESVGGRERQRARVNRGFVSRLDLVQIAESAQKVSAVAQR